MLRNLQATTQIRSKYPDIGIIALTFKEDDDSIIEMLEAGANGYIVKSALKKEIFEAVVSVYHGKNYFCSITSSKFVDLMRSRNFSRHSKNSKPDFSDRELQIIALICREYTAKEIAAQLLVTKRTIETHKRNIQEKMSVHSSAGIIIYALKNKLLEI